MHALRVERLYRSSNLIHIRRPQKHCKLPGILEIQPRGVSWSDNTFYFGLYGVVNSLLIPESFHKSLNSFDENFLPLSDQKILIFFFVWFSIKALNFLNFLYTSSLFFIKYIHVFLEKSSMKET